MIWWISLIATVSAIVSCLWILRHYERYTNALIATSFLLAGIAIWNSLMVVGVSNLPQFASHKVWYDVLVIFMSVMIAKCGLSPRYLAKTLCNK